MFTFVETPLFSRLVSDYLSDDEYRRLQESLAENPDEGDLIRGSGGLRKIRWSGSGRGKRGGVRVIYYVKTHEGMIWLLTLYAKNEAESIPTKILKKIAEEIDNA